MDIHYATLPQLPALNRLDRHLEPEELHLKISRKEIIAAVEEEALLATLRFNYFWDLIPFVNLIQVSENHRGKGIGGQLIRWWETEMKRRGYRQVMTSSQSDESGQHFFRKMGYRDAGGLLLPGEVTEVVFWKALG